MPKIYSYIETEQTNNTINDLINDGSGQFDDVFNNLPPGPSTNPETDVEGETDLVILTDISTDYTITTDVSTDFTVTTDLSTDFIITTDTDTDFTILTDIFTDEVILTDFNTNFIPTDTDIIPTDINTNVIETDTDQTGPNTDAIPEAIDARDYEVFAALWPSQVANYATTPALVPMVFMDDFYYADTWKEYKFYIGPCTTDIGDDDISERAFNDFKNKLLEIPEGRRVLKPFYWLLQTPQGGVTNKAFYAVPRYSPIQDLYYHELDGGTIEKNGQTYKYLGPWYEQNALDVGVSVKNFLQKCRDENLTFDYIADSPENYGRDGLWWVGQRDRNVYCAFLRETLNHDIASAIAYSGIFNPHRLEGIVKDSRFRNLKNPLTNRTALEEFWPTYKILNDDNNTLYKRTSLNLRDDYYMFPPPGNQEYGFWFRPTENINTTNPAATTDEQLDAIFNLLYGYDDGRENQTSCCIPLIQDGVVTCPTNIYPNNFYTYTTNDQASTLLVGPPYSSTSNAITRAFNVVLFSWLAHYRNEIWNNALQQTGYNNVKVSVYSYVPFNAEDAKYTIDYNGGNWMGGGALPTIIPERFTVTPQFYGWATPLIGRIKNNQIVGAGVVAYIEDPQTDDEKYVYVLTKPRYEYNQQGIPVEIPLPDGYKRFDSGGWLAFLTDIQALRAVFRADSNAWKKMTPWIPSFAFDNSGVGGMEYLSDDVYGAAYLKELIYHCCIGGTVYFNLLGGDPNSNVVLQKTLDEWRNISRNSRSEPIFPVSRDLIPLNSKVIVSGGRLLSGPRKGKYIWRVTAISSQTLNRFVQFGTNRTDIPQEVILPTSTDRYELNRGFWIVNDSPEPPSYALDIVPPPPPPDDDDEEPPTNPITTIYLSDFDAQYRTPNLFRMKALYGGNREHDYGSGIGINSSESVSSGAINYFKFANIETLFKYNETDSLYQYMLYHDLDSNATPINHIIDVGLGFTVSLNSVTCNVGEPIYNSEPLSCSWFRQEMSESGEWGTPLRENQPYPNNENILNNTVISYTKLRNNTIITKPDYDPNKPLDLLWEYSDAENSFWNRNVNEGGRSDLAYTYTGTYKSGYEYPIWKNQTQIPVTQNSGTESDNETPTLIPSAPSGLTGSRDSTTLQLQWLDNSVNEVGFKVYGKRKLI
jgi:hypothetical protein